MEKEEVVEPVETTTEAPQDSIPSESEVAEEESELQQPYKDSLDYLNDQRLGDEAFERR